jgi:hypothetical protein
MGRIHHLFAHRDLPTVAAGERADLVFVVRADGIFRHRKPVHAAGGEKALLHHLVEVG